MNNIEKEDIEKLVNDAYERMIEMLKISKSAEKIKDNNLLKIKNLLQ